MATPQSPGSINPFEFRSHRADQSKFVDGVYSDPPQVASGIPLISVEQREAAKFNQPVISPPHANQKDHARRKLLHIYHR